MNHCYRLLVIFCAFVFLSPSLFAQRPTATPPRQEARTSEKALPASDTSCQPVVDVCDVLKQYAALTHFRLIHDNFVQGKISLDLSGLPPDKAIDTIERTFFVNGFAIVQLDPDTVEIVGTGKNPRTVGVQIITDRKDLPRGERVISYMFKPAFGDVQDLQQILGQYLSPPQTYTSFLALPKANALLITERTTVIRSIIEIVDAIDASHTPKTP
jgi:type II secretory pathway component GspD/PulD (secretin)